MSDEAKNVPESAAAENSAGQENGMPAFSDAGAASEKQGEGKTETANTDGDGATSKGADSSQDGLGAGNGKDGAGQGEKRDGEENAKDGAGAFDQGAWDAYVDKIEGASDTDKAALKEFGGIAGELNISVENAGKLLKWAQNAGQKQREAYARIGRDILQKEWGADYDRNIEQAVSVVALADRKLGDNRFRNAIERAGIGADPDFCRGLKYLAEQLGEDSLGAKSLGTDAGHAESSYEALKGMFK